MLPCMWLNDDVMFDFTVVYSITPYLACDCDPFLHMLAFL